MKYGSLYIAKDGGRNWIVDAPAHVLIKLKRVFPRLGSYARETYVLSDTPECARDLSWFCDRYPLAMSEETRTYLDIRATEHKERESVVDALLAGRAKPPLLELALPARSYQLEAAALYLATGGLLLADDLGTGKTASAICSFCDDNALPALVVTMTALPGQWRREIQKFAPALRVAVLQSGKPYDLTKGCDQRHDFTDREPGNPSRCRKCGARPREVGTGKPPLPTPDVIVTSYSKLEGWGDTLANLAEQGGLASVVFDECQELRRAYSAKREPTKKYAAAKLIADRVQFRLGCSATPIYNWGSEFFNVTECLRPGSLGTRDEFMTEWCEGSYSGDQARIKDPKAFGLYVRQEGLMLRRTRADVGRELPPITNVLHKVEANLDALDEVGDRCAELARFLVGIDKATPNGTSPPPSMGPVTPEAKKRGEHMLASEELSWKLRMATGVAKAPYVAEFVRLVAEQEKKIILAGWHRSVYAIWMDLLSGAHDLPDLKPVLHTGSETAAQKEAARVAFVEGDSQVLIMSLRSGAGVDGLQRCCRTIVYGELDWSPGVHEQLSGRPHRDGQTDAVFAYYLFADEGSDPIVMDALGLKGEQASAIKDPEAELVEQLSGGGHHVRKLAEAYLAQREKRERRRLEAAQ